MRITVVGDGGWGTACACMLHGYGHDVTVWGAFEEIISKIRQEGENKTFLPGVPLPAGIRWTSDPAEACAGAELFVLVTPSKFFAQVCSRFAGIIPSNAKVVSLTKGFSENGAKRMSQIAVELLGLDSIAVLSGPSHAEEVARRIPTAVVAASENIDLAVEIQRVFSGPYFRVYTTSDLVGVEVGGAVKNVCAIAVGTSDGLGFGDNTRAAIITRALVEIKRFGIKLGARPETFDGLSGTGDLIVTCTSQHSRNHYVGEQLGKGRSMDEILSSMKMVAEGVWNAKAVHEISAKLNISMPISELVYKFCYEGYNVKDAVSELMMRDMKSE